MRPDNYQELNRYQVNALLGALDNTGVRLFMYYPKTKIITVPKNACDAYRCSPVYENMPQSFADDFVHSDDYSAFSEMYYRIDRGEKTADAVFHSKDLNFCHHVTLTAVGWDEKGKPDAAVGIIEDISAAFKSDNLVHHLQRKLAANAQEDNSVQEAVKLIADVISGSYRTIYHIWLEDNTFVNFLDERYTNAATLAERTPINLEATRLFIENNVEPEYQHGVSSFFALDTMAGRLKNVDRIDYIYRRKKFGWTKAELTAVKRDENGTAANVIFTVRDIDEEVTREARKKETEFELVHDPLTKAYNRKAFEDMEESENSMKGPIGFAVIDIDNFKGINDVFGHEKGDFVLEETTKLLINALRPDDKVFRIGGDEFAILLVDCKPSAWEPLCEKQRQIHISLDNLIDDASITLSIGIVFCPDGYNKELFKLADEQLYIVKGKGRAGAAMINTQTGQTDYWRDDTLSYKAQNVLGFNNTGLYRIEFPVDLSVAPRLICGDSTRKLFGFPKEASPEECYRSWVDRIDPSYLDALNETRKTAMNGCQAECTYQWNHPTQGKMYIRSGGCGEVVNDVQIIHGYHHTINDTVIVERRDDKQLLFDSMSAIYFCVYYIDLEKDSFSTLKRAPGEKYLEISENKASDAIGQFIKGLVNKKEYKRMAEFTDLGTLPERMNNEKHLDCEYQSTAGKGWCRATFFPVKYDAGGRLSHVLFVVTSLDERKALEAKRNKEAELIADKRQASLEAALKVSDQICCEYDPKTHIIECLIEDNFLNLPKTVYNYPDSMADFNFIHPNDMELFLRTARAVDGTDTRSCTIRCLRDGEYRWFTCTFSPYYDTEKGRNIAIFNMQDVTLRMDRIHSYEERLRSLLAAKEDAISMCMINVTQDTFEMVDLNADAAPLLTKSESFETVMLGVVDRIVGEESRKAYKEMFCRGNLLKQAACGNTHVQLEYLIRMEEGRDEWLTAGVDLIKNPITEDIVGVAYSRASGISKMTEAIFDKSLQQDYLFATIIYTDTDEFYTYNPAQGRLRERRTDYWNKALKDAVSRSSEETIRFLQSKITKDNVLSHLEGGNDYSFSYDSMFNGQAYRLEIRFSYTDESKSMILAAMRNVTDTALLNKYRHESEHDSLTDLYNRKTTFTKAGELLEAFPDEQFVMLHVDLQHFRLYNTFFGEAAGDKLLCYMADHFRLLEKEDEHLVIGRIEADVFCAFFPYIKEHYDKYINDALNLFRNYRTDFLIEPKVGVYFVTDKNMPIDSMFTRATLAAKAVRPGTPFSTVVYDETLEEKLTTEQQILNDMQSAVSEEQFEVYLQPKYSLRTNKPLGAEALVRWRHPKKGLISPGAFIPAFEKNGHITTLDRYMWEHVCQLLCKWKKEGRAPVPVSVNVSRLSMFGSTTVEFLKGLVQKYDIDPKYLELELTESAYMDDPEDMQMQMLALKDAGFTILLDDFGSGYSSLNTLREIPVDVLKLDMKFLSSDKEDIRGGLVISSIIRMAKLLNLVVVAEGVETREQADFLKGVGCEYVQGFLFARPMPAVEYEKILDKHNEPVIYEKRPDIRHISHILAETGSGACEMGTVIPVPLACIEYAQGNFRFLRVNPSFYSEFELNEDLRPVSEVFKNRMTQKSRERLFRAFEESIKNNKKVSTPVIWTALDGTKKKYICNVSYEGSMGHSSAMVVAFSQITDEIMKAEE